MTDLYCCTDMEYIPFLSYVLYLFFGVGSWTILYLHPLLDEQEVRHLLDGTERARDGCLMPLGANSQSLKEHLRKAASGEKLKTRSGKNHPAGLSV